MKMQLISSAALALVLSSVSFENALANQIDKEGLKPPVLSNDDDFRFQSQWGNIDPFYGDINPFYGSINPFYGDISPFWGNIDPFWGNIDPFYGSIDPFWGSIDPFWGTIDPFHSIDDFHASVGPFWREVGPMWGDISAFWGSIDPFTDATADAYQLLSHDLHNLFEQAEAVFGDEVKDDTGLSFHEGFLNELLSGYDIDLSDPQSLEDLTDAERSMFFLDFYDRLMAFTDADRVDHWMATINWTPAISQAAGHGKGVDVGIIDFSLPKRSGIKTKNRGEKDYLGVNHGFAVAGLVGAPHDGKGVMGMAHKANITVYNPFDSSFTANWSSVNAGLEFLLPKNENRRSGVINLSIGVNGWTFHPDWQSVFSRKVTNRGKNTVFVFAAGNASVSQDADVDWSQVGYTNNLLIVGSVNPTGEISPFSNTPGTACFTIASQCETGNRLMDRFLVAPGELILVGDGDKDYVRMSGTSFAAPMVSAAAALIAGRWSWLEAPDITDVLLRSATDLGEPGVDEVYGWGLLNVDAAMSPLPGSELFYFDSRKQAKAVEGLGLILKNVKFKASSDNSVVVFEALNDTFRDFELSLADLVKIGESDATAPNWSAAYNAERIYSYSNGASFTDTLSLQNVMTDHGRYTVMAFASPADPRSSRSVERLSYQTGIEIADRQSGHHIKFGFGESTLAQNTLTGFGLFSDHRPETGGVNPILGLASGGAFSVLGTRIGENRTLSFGISTAQNSLVFENPFSGEQSALVDGLPDYKSSAFIANLNQDIGEQFHLNMSYTLLNEATGFLGAQGIGLLAMNDGSTTDALTLGAEHIWSDRLTVSASGTLARTRQGRLAGETLSVSDAAISTAFQVSARFSGVMHKTDGIRFSLIQPLHLESGKLGYSAMRVVDRETGTLGSSYQDWQLGGKRSVQFEMLYATPLLGDRAELNLFNRIEVIETSQFVNNDALASGVRLKIEF